ILVVDEVVGAHVATHARIARRDAMKAGLVQVAQRDQAAIGMAAERRRKLLSHAEADHADAERPAHHRAPARSMVSAAAMMASRPCPASGWPSRARIASTRCRSSSVSTESCICGCGSALSKLTMRTRVGFA